MRDSKYNAIRRPEAPIAYLPDAQHLIPEGPTFALKASGDLAQLPDEIRRVVHELEPTLPVTRIRTYREQIGQQLSVERSLSLLSTAFGVVALLLAAVGLYGVVAFAVARRTAEMGVRLALGASRSDVLRLVMADSAKVDPARRLRRVSAARWRPRGCRSLLYGLKPTDPLTSSPRWRCCWPWRPSRRISRRAAPRASIRWKRCGVNSGLRLTRLRLTAEGLRLTLTALGRRPSPGR